jgi:6-phosphogluconate dehydrogenase
MAKFKDFAIKNEGEKEPISFKLHDEEFHCVPEIQGSVMLTIIEKTTSDNPADAALLIKEFFKNVLKDESYERFETLIHHKEKIVSMETFSTIIAWLLEQYGSRPEAQPEA